METKIAVIIPVYNCQDTILKAIDSLCNQNYKGWLGIIINDGSTDDTREILKPYGNDLRFIIIDFKSNKGKPYARQIALNKVRELGVKYMAMLDADDWYYPDKLNFQYDYMEHNPNVSLLSMSFGLVNCNNDLFGVTEPYSKKKTLTYDRYEKYVSVPHASSILRVKDIGNCNFDLSMKFGQDQDFMRRFLLNKQYVFIPKISYIYTRENSFSFQKYKHSKKLYLQAYFKLPVSFSHKLKACLLEGFKLFYVFILSKLGKEKLYLKKIGRSPKKEELKYYDSQCSLLNRYL
jgi:glycosyltransferase involved in cell wall biosynthesis